MAELVDSGVRKDFGTGAVREIVDGKGREDLLPLDIIARFTKDDILLKLDTFRNEKRDLNLLWEAYELFAIRRYGDDYPNGVDYLATSFLEVSKQYEDGARKYADDNWRKGISTHCYLDSAIRHYFKWLRGDKDEPHDRAFMWNILSLIWTLVHVPSVDDLPKLD